MTRYRMRIGMAAALLVMATAPVARRTFAQGAEGEPASQTTEEKVDAVDQRIRILERQLELEKEQAAEKAKGTLQASAGKDGFVLKSADGDYQLRIRGYIQTDGRFFEDDVDRPATDTLLIRRARPIFEATLAKRFDFKIMPDFGDGKTVLQEAYAEVRLLPAFGIRAGKFKVPFGLERLQSATNLPFLERALPNNLVPNRDVGLQVQGQFLEGTISYAAGVFNGVPDGGSADIDVNNGKEIAGRAFFHPFRRTSAPSLRGLGVGIAATYGDNRGTPASSGLGAYRTVAQQAFFTYRIGTTDATAVVAEGRGVRLSPQLYYFVGWFGLLADQVSSSHEVRIGGQTAALENDAWQATAMFVLTGEQASYSGVVPKSPIDARWNGGGAVELVARYGELSIDGGTFPVFADPAVSARQAREAALAVNWYLNRHMKMMLDASVTRFDGGGASGADREDEKVLLTRLQLAF